MSLLPREHILFSLSPRSGAGSKGAGSAGATASHVALLDLSTPTPTSAPLILRSSVPVPASSSLSFVPSTPSLGGMVVHSDANKALIHVNVFSRESLVQRLLPPEPIKALSLSPSGAYLVAGARDNGHVYVWETSSGRLEASWDAHYRGVESVVWTRDASAFVTAGKDSRVCVWSLPGVLNPGASSDDILASSSSLQPQPYAVFTDHSLPVTSLAVSTHASFPSGGAKVYSASQDGTVKVWDLRSRRLLSTFVLPSAVLHISVDPTERFFYAACGPAPSSSSSSSGNADGAAATGGVVYRVDLYRKAAGEENSWEARGGGGLGDAERIRVDEALESAKGAIRTPALPTSMCLSQNATTLLVGLETGSLLLVDVSTSQILRSVPLSPSQATSAGAVSNLAVLWRPVDMASTKAGANNAAGASSMAAGENRIPQRIVGNLERTMRERRNEDEVGVKLDGFDIDEITSHVAPPSLASLRTRPASTTSTSLPSLRTLLSQPSSSTRAAAGSAAPDAMGLGDNPAALRAEIETLRAQLKKSKDINRQMWNEIVASGGGAEGTAVD